MRVLLLVAAAIALIMVVRQALLARRRRALASARGGRTASTAPAPPLSDTLDLRRWVLGRGFCATIPPAPNGERRAVVMDWGLDNGTATLVAYDDDTTSLYHSGGGGVIGAGAHEAVKRAARAFRAEVEPVRSHFSTVAADDPLSLPSAGTVAFYVVTDSATLRAGPVDTDLLATNAHALAPLGNRAQAVITAIRELPE